MQEYQIVDFIECDNLLKDSYHDYISFYNIYLSLLKFKFCKNLPQTCTTYCNERNE